MNKQGTIKKSSLWLYILLWLFFVYLYIQLLQFNQSAPPNVLIGGMYFILFGIHEAAHIVLMFLPSIFVASAGSLSEIGFTSLLVFAAVRAKAWFAGIFASLWLMLAFTSAGNYMADARTQAMPLIGPGADPKHDWFFVFSELGVLDADVTIGTTVRIIGAIIGALALLFGLLMIISVAMRNNSNSTSLSTN
jgi:hypothetical protein